MLMVVLPHPHTVTGYYWLRRLDRIAVELDVPGTHGIGCLTARFEHTHGPYPGIDAYGQSVSIRCCFR